MSTKVYTYIYLAVRTGFEPIILPIPFWFYVLEEPTQASTIPPPDYFFYDVKVKFFL